MSASKNYLRELKKDERAVAALKSVLLRRIEIEKELSESIFHLTYEYQNKFIKLHEESLKIVQGRELTETDIQPLCSLAEKIGEVKKGTTTQVLKEVIGDVPISSDKNPGLENYWLTALKNFPQTGALIQPNDEDLLSYLTDIRAIELKDGETLDEYSHIRGKALIIEFHFAPNSYFNQKVLYKAYELGFKTDDEFPFDFEGFMPLKYHFSEIDWNKEKNLTLRITKKTQKNKITKATRVVCEQERTDSFFNIFSEISAEDVQQNCVQDFDLVKDTLLVSEYEFAVALQNDLIPKSVIYFLDEGSECESETEMTDDSSGYDNENFSDDGDTEDMNAPVCCRGNAGKRSHFGKNSGREPRR